MVNLKLRSEYSFRTCFGKVDDVVKSQIGKKAAGIADWDSTWSHYYFYNSCKKNGIKPILGVQITVVRDLDKDKNQKSSRVTILAKNARGLKEIYETTTLAWKQMYYVPRLTIDQLSIMSSDVIVLSGCNPQDDIWHPELWYEMNPGFGFWNNVLRGTDKRIVCTSDMYFVSEDDRKAYEAISDNPERKTTEQHIMSDEEMTARFSAFAIDASEEIADTCEEYDFPQSYMVEFPREKPLLDMCLDGSKARGMYPLNEEYTSRLTYELEMISQKKFEDYFYLVSDLIKWSKKHMFVGPARGSSAGSLVCYLLFITEVDPIKFDLLFERFIDLTRNDLPDIDVDFPDDRRSMAIDYLVEKYGENCVSHIGTVTKYKPKSAIGEVAKKYGIPAWETVNVKNSIIDRSQGDSRAAACLKDTFDTIDVAKEFVAKFPSMRVVEKIEDHARNSGCHAAGIIVSRNEITDFCSVSRDNVAQVDKKTAESIGALKIDVLGLRTLGILNCCMEMLGRNPAELYDVDLTDTTPFELVNTGKFSGIFQFEGGTVQSMCREMRIGSFDDIATITSIARPGPLNCGGATSFVKRKMLREDVEYDHPICEKFIADTLGVIVYQEQIMQMSREIGMMSWTDVCIIRKAVSKSYGEEFFGQFIEKFVAGAKTNGIDEETAMKIWGNMCTFGCLSGDSEIELPMGNQYSPRKITIKELYENEGYSVNRNVSQSWKKVKIWCHTGELFTPKELVSVYKSGEKETWLITLKDGKSLRATKEHKFFLEGEWKPLSDIKVGDKVRVLGIPKNKVKVVGPGSGAHNEWHGDWLKYKRRAKELKVIHEGKCQLCSSDKYTECHHIDEDRKNNEWENLMLLCRKCHRKVHNLYDNGSGSSPKYERVEDHSEVISISDPITEMTYDISMPDIGHNFVANGISVHNSYGFNKAHAVSYAMISYYCMWLKYHHPLEFAVACLRNEKDQPTTKKMLREIVNEGIKFKAFDYKHSSEEWTIFDGGILGGFKNVKGIGPAKAKEIIKRRDQGLPMTHSQMQLSVAAETPYDNLFEITDRFKDIYDNPEKYKITSRKPCRIVDIEGDGTWVFVARLLKKDVRDMNSYDYLVKRGGVVFQNNTQSMILEMEDDTGSIKCSINRFLFEKYGKPIMNEGKLGDFFLIKGNTSKDYNVVQISAIRSIE